MSKIGNSFIRGFGATLGSFAARSLVSSAIAVSNQPMDEMEKKNTRSMWKLLFVVSVVCLLIGKYTPENNHVAVSLFVSFVFIAPIVNLFVVKYKKKKRDSIIRNNLNVSISETQKRARENGINLKIPNTSSMSLYYLEELSIDIIRLLNKKIRLKEKYENHEFFDKIIQDIPWIGMSVENLKDIKGNPSSYEVSENSKTKTEILLYGANKWSGDVFTFKNGILTEFKDR